MQEPTVLDVGGGTYRMWYSGGWANEAIGTATSADGLTWTKYASNPVIGMGNGGIAGACGRPFVVKDGATYHLYFNVNSGATFKHCTSADGITWTAPTDVFTIPFGTIAGNCAIVIDAGTWRMIYEALDTVWKLGYATSPNGTTWTNQAGPLTDLSRGGAYGGPSLRKTGSLWELWYHAAASGNLPTDIYHATSANLTAWTVQGQVLGRSLAFEVDQVADSNVLTVGSEQWMYYAGMNNPAEAGSIGRATRPA